jgi:rSAM/selenodomain-associated transferase 2
MISVIIPAYNEEDSIRSTVTYVYANATYKRFLSEVIVVDCGSTDNTVAEAQKTPATVVHCRKKNRAAQLNFGAQHATGKILYFLHPKSLPPEHFTNEIIKACTKGYACGSFAMKFDRRHWLLNAISRITTYNLPWLHFSDQSLYMTKELFDKSGGFREDHLVMEDHEMISRLKRYTNFVVLKDKISTPSARYLKHGIYWTEIVHAIVFCMYRLKYSQEQMVRTYRSLLNKSIYSHIPMEPAKLMGHEDLSLDPGISK